LAGPNPVERGKAALSVMSSINMDSNGKGLWLGSAETFPAS